MNFDKPIDRRGTNCAKWDKMEALYGVSNDTGISMWVADMDFHPPTCIQDALQSYVDHGVYGYYGNDKSYRDAICWWQENRHGWTIDPSWIFSVHGLVNGTAMCIEAFTNPGDGVVMFTPIYHAFFRVLKASGRLVLQCPLQNLNNRHEFDFDLYDSLMTGNEKALVFCSPHNPSGRVWTRKELRSVADFAKRHDLTLISDEIHQDIVYPGQKHIPFGLADDSINNRLVIMNAPTKTFNIAGAHTGHVIIPDPKLRERFEKRMIALGISPNSFGIIMTQAGYSLEGAEWVDAMVDYVGENRRLFEGAIDELPGISSFPLEATYLSWVNFLGTGMNHDEICERVQKRARIAPNHGETFGLGGEGHLRFNLATQRHNIINAIDRLKAAFADLQ